MARPRMSRFPSRSCQKEDADMRREGSKKPSGLFDNMKPMFTGRPCPAVTAIIVVVACGSSGAVAQGARIARASTAAIVQLQGQGLAAVGPIDPANGFPQFYQDKAGLSLGHCLEIGRASCRERGKVA